MYDAVDLGVSWWLEPIMGQWVYYVIGDVNLICG